MDFGITGIAAITVICYLIAETIKATKVNSKWLPAICGFAGLILGMIGKRIMPDFPANDFITAAAIGIVSGFAATGVNQLYKQLFTGDSKNDKA